MYIMYSLWWRGVLNNDVVCRSCVNRFCLLMMCYCAVFVAVICWMLVCCGWCDKIKMVC